MVILGIDTSCDETSASILKEGKILSNIVFSQDIHSTFGGVVPSLASKDHEKNIYKTVNIAVNQAKINITNIDAIAVTYTPGLIACLLVGLNFAKGLSIGLDIPLIHINHLEGHLCSYLMNNTSQYPYICLLVSGGHTQIWIVNNNNDFNIISTTVDDAAGEAFDKGAKLLGLKYPGGPEIEKKSINGNNKKYKFSIPIMKTNKFNFSFSGTKTALYYLIKDMSIKEVNQEINNISASYQENILDILFSRLILVIKDTNINNISVVGGVSCNKRFQEKAKRIERKYNVNINFPEQEFCTDNAAMIAMSGFLKIKNNLEMVTDLDICPISNFNY